MCISATLSRGLGNLICKNNFQLFAQRFYVLVRAEVHLMGEEMKRIAVLSALAFALSGCVGNPDFDLRVKDSEYGSAVFRVASIMANVKCELWEAANSVQELPSFRNDTDLKPRDSDRPEPGREFNLQNIFSAVAYVGEMSITLDATEKAGTTPSANFFGWGSEAHPLSVTAEASLSEVGHRESTTYHSVDFERLVKGNDVPAAFPPRAPCRTGTELSGPLKIREILQAGLVASDMNDLSVWPGNVSNPGAKGSGVEDKYSAGQIHAVIDFTTVSSVSGGPTWSLRHFEGPGKGLLSASRVAKHQLIFTFIPICIREKHQRITTTATLPYEYKPKLPRGAPRWANYLPPCGTPSAAENKAAALGRAHNVNILERSRELRILQ